MRTGELYQRYHGLYLGTVVNTEDPENLGRVRVKLDQFEDSDSEPIYAAVARPVANGDTTVFFTPQSGDQVIVGYLAGDVNEPIILGYAHSKKGTPPSEVSAPNVHGVVTSIGRVTFDEQLGKVEVVFNGLFPGSGSSITMDSTGVRIHSDLQVLIEAKAINLAAPSIGFAGTPTFLGVGAPLPGPGAVPDKVEMNFGDKPLEFTTGGDTFCVNQHRVVLDTFVTGLFATHVHASTAPGNPTSPTSLPYSLPAAPIPITEAVIPPGSTTRC